MAWPEPEGVMNSQGSQASLFRDIYTLGWPESLSGGAMSRGCALSDHHYVVIGKCDALHVGERMTHTILESVNRLVEEVL